MEKHQELLNAVEKITERLGIAEHSELAYFAANAEVWKRTFEPKTFTKATKHGSTLVEMREYYLNAIIANGTLERFVSSLGEADLARAEALRQEALAKEEEELAKLQAETTVLQDDDEDDEPIGPYDLSPEDRLNALYAAGIDNWEWYDESLSDLSDDASAEEVWNALEAGGVDNWEWYSQVDWAAYA